MLSNNLPLVPLWLAQDLFELGYKTELIQVYNSTTAHNPLDFEMRRVQSNGRSLVTVLPKIFTDQLGIVRGDLIRFHINIADKRKLVIEKISIAAEELPSPSSSSSLASSSSSGSGSGNTGGNNR